MTTINKSFLFGVFKTYGHRLEILRTVKKGSSFSIYLPLAVSQALGLNKDDYLVGFIDDESNFTYLILVKDSDLAQQLRPLIYEKRRRAEILHKELKRQFETQKQQNVASVDAEVIE